MQKKRLTVTVDPALVKAGTTAVRRGLARSLSDWGPRRRRVHRARPFRPTDVGLVAIARDDDRILTSDPGDLAQLLEAAKIRAEIVVV